MRCVIEFVHTIVLTKHFDWQVKIADKLKKLLNDYFRAERKFREDLWEDEAGKLSWSKKSGATIDKRRQTSDTKVFWNKTAIFKVTKWTLQNLSFCLLESQISAQCLSKYHSIKKTLLKHCLLQSEKIQVTIYVLHSIFRKCRAFQIIPGDFVIATKCPYVLDYYSKRNVVAKCRQDSLKSFDIFMFTLKSTICLI